MSKKTGKNIKCEVCSTTFHANESSLRAGRRYCRYKCYWATLSKKKIGDKNPKWKGDRVGYHGVHDWIKLNYGKPNVCEECGKTNLKGKQIHWANISGKYKRDIKDWKRLCAKCHWQFDKQFNRLRNYHGRFI